MMPVNNIFAQRFNSAQPIQQQPPMGMPMPHPIMQPGFGAAPGMPTFGGRPHPVMPVQPPVSMPVQNMLRQRLGAF